MALDWLFSWMTEPGGLLILAGGLVLPFILWRVLLGRRIADAGYGALAAGLVAALAALVAVAFLAAYIDFSRRVAGGLLEEAGRWSIVPGWTIYGSVVALVVVLPLLVLAGTPVAALLFRTGWLSYPVIVSITIAGWLAVTMIAWLRADTEWDRAHRLESLTSLGTELFMASMIGAAFLLAIRVVAGSGRR